MIGILYRTSSLDIKTSTENLVNMLYKLNTSKHDSLILTGDFNYSKINWKNTIRTSENDGKFIKCMNYPILVLNPARHRE